MPPWSRAAMGSRAWSGRRALTIDVQAKTARLGEHDAARGRHDHDRRWHRQRDRRRGRSSFHRRSTRTSRRSSSWADDLRRLSVRANADTPDDADKAREFGAQGIGLCRTEHMFIGRGAAAALMREMILAADEAGAAAALDRLLPIQQGDFEGIFEAMAGLPVTIRLLDWPLHEFLPSLEERDRPAHARAHPRAARGEPDARARARCRLGLVYPEIYEMQVRAIVARGCRRSRADRRGAARRDHAPARRASPRSCAGSAS